MADARRRDSWRALILVAIIGGLAGCYIDCPERSLLEAVRKCKTEGGEPVFTEDGWGVGCDLTPEVPCG